MNELREGSSVKTVMKRGATALILIFMVSTLLGTYHKYKELKVIEQKLTEIQEEIATHKFNWYTIGMAATTTFLTDGDVETAAENLDKLAEMSMQNLTVEEEFQILDDLFDVKISEMEKMLDFEQGDAL